MEKEEVFEAWAPAGGVWSPWAKPVLFAHLPRPLPGLPPPAPFPTQGIPSPGERQALVVEMPGLPAVTAGLALAEAGYWPVPVFNACPPPWTDLGLPLAAVDVDVILAAMVRGADRLRMLHRPADAPPVFLVDADRQTARLEICPGVFDNRSVLFTTDFPSADFLTSHGIEGVVLVRYRGGPVAWDLAEVLRGWRRGGVALREWRLEQPGAPAPLNLPRFWYLTDWWRRLWASLSLRPNPHGGFGDLVPHPSGG